MKMMPYLSFNGQCEAAFKFYEKALGGKINFKMTHGESPMADKTPDDWKDKIMHISLDYDGQTLGGSDAPPQFFSQAQGFCVSLAPETIEEAERIFAALSENGTIKMPIQETFWSPRFGMFIDQFGTPWMVNCIEESTA